MAGSLIVVSGPSGSGKTSIVRALLLQLPQLEFSVSATTRAKRAGETHGKDYHFLVENEFRRRVAAGEFVEWEEIYGNLYGTLRAEVDAGLASGRVILFDIDVKGALSIKRQYPEAVLIFIRPPGIEELERRLRARLTEDEASLARRMERAAMEMDLGKKFDYAVVNDSLSRATDEVVTIVRKHL